ncbi:coiled-coil domain-containing protein 9B isoform X2 [Malurus melanocephalus]|uniref:coiled-coil domain-containing protein 9B isoform X2 n=1 Tax=Malurus melanocephalus TaxID=175006 RepID=UPI002548C9A0|nr:coiled-coil domain-containing protein 9B isoform X2 [Malurus melanocephalus]
MDMHRTHPQGLRQDPAGWDETQGRGKEGADLFLMRRGLFAHPEVFLCSAMMGISVGSTNRQDAAVDDAVLRKKEQKDVELDKKILALRKKNEALIRRYQEIEEDKKRAEQEGMAVTSRRPKQDGLTITITKAHNDLKDAITQTEHYGQDSPALSLDKRVVSEKWGSPCPTSPGFGIGSEEEEEEEEEEADHMFTFRMGKRMQLAVTMDNKAKGKRIVSEKRAESFPGPGRAPELSEEETDHLVAFRRGRRMQIAITMDNKEKREERRTAEKRRSDSDRGPESEHSRKDGGKPVQKSLGDLSFPMTGRERSEYIRWKREREQIDLERLARHKNAKGEWRRAWDVEKSEHMFEEDFVKDGEPALDNPSNKKGGRNARKFQHKSFPPDGRGGHHGVNVSDPGPKAVPAVSSRAKGKDRLTGRARRWDAKEGEDMSFLKDELDGQRNLGADKRKSRSDEGVEEDCTAELEEKGKQPSLQDHGASSSQWLRNGKVQPAHNGQKEEQRGVRSCSTEVSVVSAGDSEPGPKPGKESVGEDASRKSGTAGILQEKESTEGTASQGSLPSTVQATRPGSQEALSLPVGANGDGAGLGKHPASEQESSENSSNRHGGDLDAAVGDRLDADQGQLVSKGGKEVTQTTVLEGQTLLLKGSEDAEGTEHHEPSALGKTNSDKTVVPEQDMAKSQSGEGDQPEDCKDKDSGDTHNLQRLHQLA